MSIFKSMFDIPHTYERKPFFSDPMVSTPWLTRIMNWQTRQKKEKDMHTVLVGGGDATYGMMCRINDCVNKAVEYKKDIENFGQREYWQTFEEVSLRKTGDCEDQAIYKWGWLRHIFGDSKVGMIIVEGHCLCCVYLNNSPDFYVLDNGYICHTPKKASEIFPYYVNEKVLIPLVGFTHSDKWGY